MATTASKIFASVQNTHTYLLKKSPSLPSSSHPLQISLTAFCLYKYCSLFDDVSYIGLHRMWPLCSFFFFIYMFSRFIQVIEVYQYLVLLWLNDNPLYRFTRVCSLSLMMDIWIVSPFSYSEYCCCTSGEEVCV